MYYRPSLARVHDLSVLSIQENHSVSASLSEFKHFKGTWVNPDHSHNYIYGVCMCVREKEGEREKGERKRERD